jgi:hypothetical protein
MGTATAEVAEPRTAASARPARCGGESMSSRGLEEEAAARRERRAMRSTRQASPPTVLSFEGCLATAQPRMKLRGDGGPGSLVGGS